MRDGQEIFMGGAIGALGVISYGIFSALAALVRAIIAYPVQFLVGFLILLGVQNCRESHNMGGIDAVVAMRGGEAEVEQMVGSPNECSNAGSTVTCEYDDLTVEYRGGRTSTMIYRLHSEPFNLDERFYGRVLGMIGVPYRTPDTADIDRVVWRVPGLGVVTALSDRNMELAGITIHE
jgi:hypothetical protein